MKQLQEAQTIPFSNVFARIGKQNVIQYPGETISILDTGGRLFGMPQKANGFLWVLSIIENSESIWFPIHAEMDMHTLGRNKGIGLRHLEVPRTVQDPSDYIIMLASHPS